MKLRWSLRRIVLSIEASLMLLPWPVVQILRRHIHDSILLVDPQRIASPTKWSSLPSGSTIGKPNMFCTHQIYLSSHRWLVYSLRNQPTTVSTFCMDEPASRHRPTRSGSQSPFPGTAQAALLRLPVAADAATVTFVGQRARRQLQYR